MDADDRLRLDYEQTTDRYRTLVDIRFKLLAIVPTICGIAVGLLGRPHSAAELLAVGLIGLAATLGIFFYELRNTEIHDAVVERAAQLEKRLGLDSSLGGSHAGGPFGERPRHAIRLLGLIGVVHERAFALVYGAALAGWSYLVAWGALRALDLASARKVGGIIAVVIGIVVLAEVERLERRAGEAGSAG